jgi:small redox-active disulfide protein 2
MINIKVLGPGCPNCRRVERRAVEALEMLAEEDSSLEATIQHVTEYPDIMQYPIAGTPALVIDEKVVCSGRVPRQEEIAAWLKEVHGTTTD